MHASEIRSCRQIYTASIYIYICISIVCMHVPYGPRSYRAMQCAYCKAFQPSGEACPDGWWYCDACWDWWQRWLDDTFATGAPLF